ncbi:hypothetical protein ACK3TF_004658 [Chlorella vulgaris]
MATWMASSDRLYTFSAAYQLEGPWGACKAGNCKHTKDTAHWESRLLQLRAIPIGSQPQTVTLLTFSKRMAVMMQNSIYSMVKFGGVRNYLVATWDPEDLAACADLNLPCADVTALLPEPLDKAKDAGLTGSHDYLVICWLRPILVARLLAAGYAVLSTDSDIVFLAKPVWPSYLAFIDEGGADAAFQTEGAIFNGGNYVVLPSANSIAFARTWAAMAPRMLRERNHDQDGLAYMGSSAWAACTTLGECRRARANITRSGAAGGPILIRTFLPNFFGYADSFCGLNAGAEFPPIDPCDAAVMLLHPVCTDLAGKLAFFRHQGFWFLDDGKASGGKAGHCPASSGASRVAACPPRHWRLPSTELPLYSCKEYHLGLIHTHQANLIDAPGALQALGLAARSAFHAPPRSFASAHKLHAITFVTRDYLTDASVLRMTRVAAELGTRVQLQVLDSLKAGEFAEISWGLRLKALRDYCARLTSQDVVMMTDATDALVVGSPRALLEAYNDSVDGQRLVLFGAESLCWQHDLCPPEVVAGYPETGTQYRFLNAGTVMGPADVITRLLDASIDWARDAAYRQPGFHDQGFLHGVLKGSPQRRLMAVDSRCQVFCAFFNRQQDLVCTRRGWLNTHTGTYPLVLHGSGALRQFVWDTLLPTYERGPRAGSRAVRCLSSSGTRRQQQQQQRERA